MPVTTSLFTNWFEGWNFTEMIRCRSTLWWRMLWKDIKRVESDIIDGSGFLTRFVTNIRSVYHLCMTSFASSFMISRIIEMIALGSR